MHRGVILMNGGVAARDDVLHNFISASHDIMELRKLSVAFYQSDLNFKLQLFEDDMSEYCSYWTSKYS